MLSVIPHNLLTLLESEEAAAVDCLRPVYAASHEKALRPQVRQAARRLSLHLYTIGDVELTELDANDNPNLTPTNRITTLVG